MFYCEEAERLHFRWLFVSVFGKLQIRLSVHSKQLRKYRLQHSHKYLHILFRLVHLVHLVSFVLMFHLLRLIVLKDFTLSVR